MTPHRAEEALISLLRGRTDGQRTDVDERVIFSCLLLAFLLPPLPLSLSLSLGGNHHHRRRRHPSSSSPPPPPLRLPFSAIDLVRVRRRCRRRRLAQISKERITVSLVRRARACARRPPVEQCQKKKKAGDVHTALTKDSPFPLRSSLLSQLRASASRGFRASSTGVSLGLAAVKTW